MGQLHPTARAPQTFSRDLRDVDGLDGPSLEEVDIDDLDDLIALGQHAVAMDFLDVARLTVLQDAITICYRQHGPNHAVRCRPLYIDYLRRLEPMNHIKVHIDELHPTKGAGGEKKGAGEPREE